MVERLRGALLTADEALIARAVDLVRGDLESGGATGFGVSIVREPGDDRAWTVKVSDGPWRSGVGGLMPQGATATSLLVIVADRLQDAYIDLLWEARPRCPLHEHPLTADDIGDKGVWVCPAGSGWSRPIGGLATDREYLAAIGSPPVS
jgi:hypothetical protein